MTLDAEEDVPGVHSGKILAKRRAMDYLSRQPVYRTRRSNRLAPWTWLAPYDSEAWNLTSPEAKINPEEVSPLCGSADSISHKFEASALESAHETLERQAAGRHLCKVLTRKFGCDGSSSLEDLLLAKESELVKLMQEVTTLRSEKEQLEFALEAAERRIEELAVVTSVLPAEPGCTQVATSEVVELETSHERSADLSKNSIDEFSDPKEQVAMIRRERLEGIHSTMREMFLGCVELLAADIYASRAHFVLELLQNADDNEYAPGVAPCASFICKGGQRPYIAVINNEVGLTAQDLVGMCAISKSAKKDKVDRTGRKGIGFKSVFAVSSCPHILSGSYTFKFDVRHDRMGYVMPSWLEKQELETSVPSELRQFHQDGCTVIFLPISDQSEALLKEVEGHLEALDPATLLFMRRLQRVDYRCVDGRSNSIEVEGSRGADGLRKEVVNTTTEVSGATSSRTSHPFFVLRKAKGGGLNGKPSQLAIALPLEANAHQRAFATLPLCHTGLNLCINADWDVSASRDGVHENHHNELLSIEAAEDFAELAKTCAMELKSSPVEYLGDRPPLSRFWRKARERFIEALMDSEIPCLAVEVPQETSDKPTWPRFVSAKQALRRPRFAGPEQTAADLVSCLVLEQSVSKYFVQEPLPQGLHVEFFSATHFVRCLPALVEVALRSEEYVDRVKKLKEIYCSMEELFADPHCQIATIQERVELVRQSRCWPCKGLEGTVVLSSSNGPIFVESDALWHEFLPKGRQVYRWQLRVLLPEAAQALSDARGLMEMAYLRPFARLGHILGLIFELHSGDMEDRTEIPHTLWWSSLRLIRDHWTSLPSSDQEIRQEVADPLVEQGLQLLDPDIMKAVLWVPCSTGLRHGSSLNCPFLLGHEVSTSTESCQVALLPKEDHPAKVLPDLRKAFCGISIEVASIQDFYPSFGKLMEDQDAELFLVLPRLVLLTGLFEPSHGSLPCSFWVERNEAWELLSQSFLELKLHYPGDQLDFWKLLVAKALEGPGLGADGEFSKLLEKFLLQLEGLSVQLQRDDPKRWNRCCQLLLQSIATAMAVGTRVQSL